MEPPGRINVSLPEQSSAAVFPTVATHTPACAPPIRSYASALASGAKLGLSKSSEPVTWQRAVAAPRGPAVLHSKMPGVDDPPSRTCPRVATLLPFTAGCWYALSVTSYGVWPNHGVAPELPRSSTYSACARKASL